MNTFLGGNDPPKWDRVKVLQTNHKMFNVGAYVTVGTFKMQIGITLLIM